ncbi:hypothetical protein L1987_25906 [Smallanthus sonchifolius]|uniref:Uncharacterized protein n=1 Tax=Smallanthus sonchifolius TaxID=185202 RepID=A0ACB9IA77_9ASTR|nr:hypothetical protein L1987_25906 [Smallanthus sonchifolius]
MEAVSSFMKSACRANIFKGIQLSPRGACLSHLMYADNVMVLGDWSESNIRNIARIMKAFALVSGLKMNFNKTAIMGIRVELERCQNLASIIKCSTGNVPFKFLGIEVGNKMNSSKAWDPIIRSIENRLSTWKAATLSIGGRVTLLKSIFDALPVYYFSLYKAPKMIIKKIESLRKSFFWGGSMEKRKIHWFKWETVTAPKDKGGLGLGTLEDLNLSLLVKWWWRYKVEEERMWRRVIDAIHENNSSRGHSYQK